MKKGISLVALVITIIVLIIITATVIISINGESNIIKKAKNAVIGYSNKEAQELITLKLMEYKAKVATRRKNRNTR